MRTFLFWIIRSITQIALSIFILFCVYLGWSWWEMSRLNAFCEAVHVGAQFSSLPSLAEKYGFDRRWVQHGIRDGESDSWVVYVPASSSMGEVACTIRYNQVGIISSKIDS